jgi:hypothetical protein
MLLKEIIAVYAESLTKQLCGKMQLIIIFVTVTLWYRIRRLKDCDHFVIYCVFPICVLTTPGSSTTAQAVTGIDT